MMERASKRMNRTKCTEQAALRSRLVYLRQLPLPCFVPVAARELAPLHRLHPDRARPCAIQPLAADRQRSQSGARHVSDVHATMGPSSAPRRSTQCNPVEQCVDQLGDENEP